MAVNIDDILNKLAAVPADTKAGVYAITHKASGKVYVGSSRNIRSRLRRHVSSLNKGKHHARKLQNAWNKYGEEAFSFAILVVCAPDDVLMYEQIFLDFHSSATKGYNSLPKAGSPTGCVRTAETRAKMSAYAKSRSEEHTAAISRSRIGMQFSDAHREALSKAHKGIRYPKRAHPKLTPEHVEKIRQGLIGRPVSTETREKMRLSRPAGVTGVQGVTFDKRRQKYSVVVKVAGVKKYVGRYATLQEAEVARDNAR